MGQDDFQERLRRLSEKHAIENEKEDIEVDATITRSPRKAEKNLIYFSFVVLLGAVCAGLFMVWVEMMTPEPKFAIENGVPYDQIQPDTPIMQRLPKNAGLMGMLSEVMIPHEPTLLDMAYFAPEGWLRVSNTDVYKVTPMQEVYVQLSDLAPQHAFIQRLTLDLFANQYTGTEESSSAFLDPMSPLKEVVNGSVPDGAMYFSSDGGKFLLRLKKFKENSAFEQQNRSGQQDLMRERFESEKSFNGITRLGHIDMMVNDIPIALLVNKDIDTAETIDQIKNHTGTREWEFFIMPDYNTKLTFVGNGTYQEFAQLVTHLGVPFPQE